MPDAGPGSEHRVQGLELHDRVVVVVVVVVASACAGYPRRGPALRGRWMLRVVRIRR